ncbi:hypothetical protein [Mesobacillus jeotgali]|uniref:IDEAL domain-containing protein n=1 Tax=Mesobacillus jeotgali TaxID=129985 RepID=A0ABY9VI08_9BACI|nr:hypothetical protein [Mesobacillus jeotgali]WNF23574.1 hypothetical protein RH061_03415 [Mesobacillus jeotgali]
MMQSPRPDLLEQYLDSVRRLLLKADDPEIKKELSEVSDALESGSITLDTALFWDHIEARAILRKAFSDADFLILRLKE